MKLGLLWKFPFEPFHPNNILLGNIIIKGVKVRG